MTVDCFGQLTKPFRCINCNNVQDILDTPCTNCGRNKRKAEQKYAYFCYECNCSLTLKEFTSVEHANEHIEKWFNGDIATEKEILDMRKEDPLAYNTLQNIKTDQSRKLGNKKHRC